MRAACRFCTAHANHRILWPDQGPSGHFRYDYELKHHHFLEWRHRHGIPLSALRQLQGVRGVLAILHDRTLASHPCCSPAPWSSNARARLSLISFDHNTGDERDPLLGRKVSIQDDEGERPDISIILLA